MLSNISISATEMSNKMLKQDVISNNLANINTYGYKKDDIHFSKIFDAKKNEFVQKIKIQPDFSQGELVITNNPLDLAINGNGFFTILSAQGELYTRNGSLTKDSDGYLVNQTGEKVLSQNGPIIINGENVVFHKNGDILVDNEYVGTLKIISFNKPYPLKKAMGNELFKNIGGETSINPNAKFEVIQNMLERSNVSSIEEMMNMIKTFNEYESNYKAFQIINDISKKSVNEIGKL